MGLDPEVQEADRWEREGSRGRAPGLLRNLGFFSKIIGGHQGELWHGVCVSKTLFGEWVRRGEPGWEPDVETFM